MGRPTTEELHIALKEAIRLRENGIDEQFLGKSLLNLNYRIKTLEVVLAQTKKYLHSGLDGHEQVELLRAIRAAEKASEIEADDESGMSF
jgi:hypothetical protein